MPINCWYRISYNKRGKTNVPINYFSFTVSRISTWMFTHFQFVIALEYINKVSYYTKVFYIPEALHSNVTVEPFLAVTWPVSGTARNVGGTIKK